MGHSGGGWREHGRAGDDWRVRLVGAVAVRTAEGTSEGLAMGTLKARTLLAMLGAAHGRAVSVHDIMAELWGAAPPLRPRANVATLVSRLRARFGTGLLVGDRGGYRLGDGVRVDLHDAADLVTRAEEALGSGRVGEGLLAAESGLELIGGGPVLAEHPATEWAARARALQTGLLRRARHTGAECALRSGCPARAQGLVEVAIAADPLDERAYNLLMRAYEDAGDSARALLTYERLRVTLAIELGTVPACSTRDLNASIRRGRAIPA